MTLRSRILPVYLPPKDDLHSIRRTAGEAWVCMARGCDYASTELARALGHVVAYQVKV